jgi:hypothetical protein
MNVFRVVHKFKEMPVRSPEGDVDPKGFVATEDRNVLAGDEAEARSKVEEMYDLEKFESIPVSVDLKAENVLV